MLGYWRGVGRSVEQDVTRVGKLDEDIRQMHRNKTAVTTRSLYPHELMIDNWPSYAKFHCPEVDSIDDQGRI